MYGVMFQTTDCPATSGALVSKNGDWHWITVESENWVPATSMTATGGIPSDVKVFATESAAQAFIKRWPKIYHPWYGKPNGVYKTVKLKARTKVVITGYQED